MIDLKKLILVEIYLSDLLIRVDFNESDMFMRISLEEVLETNLRISDKDIISKMSAVKNWM